MKKNYYELISGLRNVWKSKLLKRMRIVAILILFSITNTFALDSYAQSKRLSFNFKNEQIVNILDEIEEQSEFYFMYDASRINVTQRKSVDFENQSIQIILDQLFENTGITYNINDRQVLLTTIEQFDTNQQNTVSGNVSDASGQPLPGVTVIVKGTTNGTVTDFDGNYSISRLSENAILQFSFVGMKTQEIVVSGKSQINVVLEEESIGIEEVVAIGYGTVKKSDLTGAVSSVNSKDLERATPINIQSAIQGRAAGVQVSQTSAAPGSEATVRIRGLGTLNNNNPIYVVDGMFVEGMNFLNISDVESIEVLKDASATAIYGSRGANGVILITTKKGSQNSPTVTFNGNWKISNPKHFLDWMDASQYYDMVKTALYNGYYRSHSNPDPNYNIDDDSFVKAVKAEYDKGYNTDWMQEMIQPNALEQNYSVSVSGKNENINYSTSIGYLNQEGVVKTSGYTRYTFRINTEYKLAEFIKVGENLGISNSRQDVTQEGLTGTYGEAMWADPLFPIYREDVDSNDPMYDYKKYAGSALTSGKNVLAELDYYDSYRNEFKLVGNVYADIDIFKDLKFHTSLGINLSRSDDYTWTPVYYVRTDQQNEIADLSRGFSKYNGWLWENTLTYSTEIREKHSLNLLAGYTSEYNRYDNLQSSKENFPSNDEYLRVMSAGTLNDFVTGSISDNSMISYFGRINYDFDDKYLLTASIRHDGSSKFGAGYKWGTFPSFSAGWRLINENFLQNLNLSEVSNIKLRFGWGQIGNQSLTSNYAYLSTIAGGTSYRYIFNNALAQGYYLSSIGTPDIKWETTEQVNFGLDLGFFSNALSLSFDYFEKSTRDMLLQVPVPSYTGYGSSIPWSNAGNIKNVGFEGVASYSGKANDFSYNISVNASTYKNTVESLGGGDVITSGPNRTEEGNSIGRFYGWVTDGIFQTDQEVTSYSKDGNLIQPSANAGDFRFKDLDGDGNITGEDRTWIGDPLPDLIYGFNINLNYKGFDLSAFFEGTLGNDIYNTMKGRIGNLNGYFNGPEQSYLESWRGEGTSNSHPIISSVDANDNYRVSDFYVEDGSYLRLKDLQLGYNFSNQLCEKLSLSNMRIWIGGTNLLTLTKYSGFDPEVSLTSSSITPGNDSFPYPKSYSLSCGLNVTF